MMHSLHISNTTTIYINIRKKQQQRRRRKRQWMKREKKKRTNKNIKKYNEGKNTPTTTNTL